MKKLSVLIMLLSFAVIMDGCTQAYKLKKYDWDSQSSVAAVHTSVISSAPWDAIKDELQPEFPLSTEIALAQAVSEGMAEEKMVLEAILAELKAGFTQKLTNITDTTTKATGQPTQNSIVISKTFEQPDISGIQANIPTALDNISPDYSQKSQSAINNRIKYSAATALYQEIALLNNYVKYASVRKGYDPYLIRLQVTLNPRTHHETCDAYSTIYFFPDRFADAPCDLITVDKDNRFTEKATGSPKMPFVVPLLVTEDYESTSYNRLNDNMLQLGLGLMAAINGIGVEGSAGAMARDFMKTSGRSYNNLMNVGRVTDNSIRVKFGAMKTSAEDGDGVEYVMAQRTYNVTLLILVPEELDRNMALISKSVLVDEGGEELSWTTKSTMKSEALLMLGKYNIPTTKNVNDKILEDFLMLGVDVHRNRLDCFTEHFKDFCDGIAETFPADEQSLKKRQCKRTLAMKEQLWAEVADLWIGGQFSYSFFQLPEIMNGSPVLPDSSFAFAAVDNKKTTAVTVTGAKGIGMNNFKPLLSVLFNEKRVKLPPLSVKPSPDGSSCVVSYQSLAAQNGFKTSGMTLEVDNKKYTLLYTNDTPSSQSGSAQSRKPEFAVTSTMQNIAMENGKGILQLVFHNVGTDGSKSLINISNAAVERASLEKAGLVQSVDKDGWLQVKKSGLVELDLMNLSTGKNVIVSSTGYKKNKNTAVKTLVFSPVIMSAKK